ncbi:MAG: CDP-diacylglycerol--serine O-phosphatidyltransferase, partial [Bdellovibrionales bacterium]|nr:CDP-diacylglycerol--serine O-phosphatidyltransferase [Bdellovibrionales bacterium]
MERKRQAYIAILPSVFTTGNLFFGFHAIVSSVAGDYLTAAYSILIAGLFDVLDGAIARLTRTPSQFGVEYDSIADVVSFGVAPALMVYFGALTTLGRLGNALAFFYLACAALRLARFNCSPDFPKTYFMGLPSPAAAYSVAVL